MARVTVEDCKKIIPNHFELVVLASRRSKDISTGSPILVEKDNDKNAVISLREIAAKKLNIDLMRENLITEFQKNVPVEENLDDNSRENYIEEDGETSFAQSFDEEMSNEGDFSVDENSFIEDNMSFEDEDLSDED